MYPRNRLSSAPHATQVYKVTESALADILAAFQDTYNDLDDKLMQVQTAYDAFTASQFGNFGERPRASPPAACAQPASWMCLSFTQCKLLFYHNYAVTYNLIQH